MKPGSTFRSVVCAAALALCPLAVRAKEYNNRVCTNASLRGDFGYAAQGTTLPALGLQPVLTGMFASGGYAHFDGQGHFTLTATSSFHGMIQGPATVTGTYSVNSDCSYTSQASNGVTFRAVIVDEGRELLILQTTSGVVITGTAQKQNVSGIKLLGESLEETKRACSAESFAGTYGFLADGFAGAPTLPGTPFGPLAGVGVIKVRQDGTFTMMAQRSVAGVLDPAPLPLTGSYTVAANCTAQLTFDVGFHFTATIINDSETAFIETDPGTALRVIAKRL
jgi:hypothetical protein